MRQSLLDVNCSLFIGSRFQGYGPNWFWQEHRTSFKTLLADSTGLYQLQFIKLATGFDTVVGHSLESCTSEIKIVKLTVPELADGDVVFVDTPGFDDTHKSDADILKMVADWLKSTYVFLNLILIECLNVFFADMRKRYY